METRKVTIINSKTQSQKVIQDSKATTLGELKTEMRERGIDFSGMTFFEGHMRAELKDDAAPLPTNIPYKGQVVNDLIFMLTTPDKKVKSGAMSRAEAYEVVKKMGLQEICKMKFGKNFTQCSTADLIALVEGNQEKLVPEVEAPKKEEEHVEDEEVTKDTPNELVPTQTSCGCTCAKVLAALIEDLYSSSTIEEETYDKCMDILGGKKIQKSEKMSKKEIDSMFNFLDR